MAIRLTQNNFVKFDFDPPGKFAISIYNDFYISTTI